MNESFRAPSRQTSRALLSVTLAAVVVSCGRSEGQVGPTPHPDAAAPDAGSGGAGGRAATTDSGTGGTGGVSVVDAATIDSGMGGAAPRDAANDTANDAASGDVSGRDAVSPDGSGTSAYTLVFNDEFDGAALDRSKWCTRYVYGGGAALQVPDTGCTGPDGFSGTLDFLNDEQQRYVDTNTKAELMHVASGGTLKMRSTKTRTDSYASYESAMIRSKTQFKPSATTSYYIIARLRLPNVKGTWPAMWLSCGFDGTNPIPWPPEIDIFEGALNTVEDTMYMIRMGSQIKGGRQTASGAREITYSSPTYERTWNNYVSPESLRGVWVDIGATWTAGDVCYYVNGLKTMCENYRWTDDAGNPANTASLLLNLAIGGSWAGRHGIDDAGFPTTFEADYVRVFSFAGPTPPGTLPR